MLILQNLCSALDHLFFFFAFASTSPAPSLYFADNLRVSKANDLFKVFSSQEIERLGHNPSMYEPRICWKESIQNSEVLDLNYRILVSH